MREVEGVVAGVGREAGVKEGAREAERRRGLRRHRRLGGQSVHARLGVRSRIVISWIGSRGPLGRGPDPN
jgi:hypothetical protein